MNLIEYRKACFVNALLVSHIMVDGREVKIRAGNMVYESVTFATPEDAREWISTEMRSAPDFIEQRRKCSQ